MTPGLYGPPFHPGAVKGALVAIGDYTSPTVPLVVGIAEIDISNLTNVSGEKGKAIRVLHWADDELYHLGFPGMKLPEKLEVPEEAAVTTNEEEGGISLEQHVEDMDLASMGKETGSVNVNSQDEPESDLPIQGFAYFQIW